MGVETVLTTDGDRCSLVITPDGVSMRSEQSESAGLKIEALATPARNVNREHQIGSL